MNAISQIVSLKASSNFHNLCGDDNRVMWQNVTMSDEQNNKNGGPNFLKAWRDYKGWTLEELADRVEPKTNANMIGYLESGERGLSAKWLRRLAQALDTTPGMILDHDPNELDADIIDMWTHAPNQQKRQISEITKTITRTGTDD